MEGTPPSGQSKTTWACALRPLLWCGLLVLILFGIRTHQRLSQQTSLTFSVSMQGRSLYEAVAKLDDKPFDNGQRVSIGWHTLVVTHPKAETLTKNLFIWYGPHDLGHFALKRAQGNLTVTVTPPADWLIIRGPEWSVTLRNSSGTNALVPADTYEVQADFPHWREKGQAIVGASFSTPLHIAPRFGVAQLECNQPDASYQLLDANGQNVFSGSLPATVAELPTGRYTITGTHHGNRREYPLFVKSDATNTAKVNFEYGSAIFETTPSDATVTDGNGRQWGKTPLSVLELLSGDWNFTLQRYGYAPVQVTLAVVAGQTNVVSTNLVSFEYISSMNAARQFLAESNYYRAGLAVDQAIQTSPQDQAAAALQRKITALSTIQNAESLGSQSNYTAGIKLLQSALQLEPDSERAKGLLTDYQKHEPEQKERERVERLSRGDTVFRTALLEHTDADLFDRHELKTTKPVNEAYTAILWAMKSQPGFQIRKNFSPAPETFQIEAVQEFSTALATSAGRRVCVVVGSQRKDDETQILFKVLEYKTEAQIKFSIGNLIGTPNAVNYVAIHPSRIGKVPEKLQARVNEGVTSTISLIQSAIAQ